MRSAILNVNGIFYVGNSVLKSKEKHIFLFHGVSILDFHRV